MEFSSLLDHHLLTLTDSDDNKHCVHRVKKKKIKGRKKGSVASDPEHPVPSIYKTERLKSLEYYQNKSLFYRLKHNCNSEEKFAEFILRIDEEITTRPIGNLNLVEDRIHFLIIKGGFYFVNKDYAKSMEIVEEAYELWKQHKDTHLENADFLFLRIASSLSTSNLNLNNKETAEKLLCAAKEKLNSLQPCDETARIWYNLARRLVPIVLSHPKQSRSKGNTEESSLKVDFI